MNQKPNILSIDDTEKVYEVSRSIGELEDALSLLKDIEEKYDIDDISFDDKQFPLGIDRYPAAVAYLKLLVYIDINASDFLSDEFLDIFPRVCRETN